MSERYYVLELRQSKSGWIGQVFANLPSSSLIVFDDISNISFPTALQMKKALISGPPREIHAPFARLQNPRNDLQHIGNRERDWGWRKGAPMMTHLQFSREANKSGLQKEILEPL